ncbi:MAG TPA: glycosyltransferase family 4 protein [Gaiellaceae bacterium]|nr:glycosyltransferase family 4 protein [Gaiellaceae bacterium]
MPVRRLRLLYVVTLAEVGGAQSYVRDLLPAMSEEFDVTVAAHGEGPLKDFCERHDIAFVPLRHVRRDLSAWRDLLGFLELVALFRSVRPDIVHLNSSKAGVLGRLAGSVARVPVRVFTAHGWAFKATSGIGAQVYLWADRIVRPLTTMIICVSQIERQAGLAARTCTAERSRVIRNGVDVDAVLPHDASESPPVRIVSVGRLAEPKNFPVLIAAVARLPRKSAGLRILGDGPQRELLTELIAERGLEQEIELVGEVEDVRPYLAESDVFVLSTRSEGMPIALLEAMAAGLPTVVSDVSGLHEVVLDGETGLLVPTDDADALASSILRVVEDAALRERLGLAARRRAVEHFALGPWRRAHLELYASLVGASTPEPA